MDLWLNKADNYLKQANLSETILICKACLEEFAEWYSKQSGEFIHYIESYYFHKPFKILEETVQKLSEKDIQDLLNYCKSEILKPKYKSADLVNDFNNLIKKMSILLKTDDFLEIHNKLWQEIKDKSSYEAKSLLDKKIEYLSQIQQPEKIWDVIKENLQIDSYREKWVKRLIKERNLSEAKKLINEVIRKENNGEWEVLKLQIAEEEKDTPEIRELSYKFIKKTI